MQSYGRKILRALLFVSLVAAFCSTFACRQTAPQFTVRTLQGGTYSSASLAGNPVLLQFWATWCPYCRQDQGALDELQRKYSSTGLVVLAIDVGESEATVNSYLEAHPRAVRIALDKERRVANRFGQSAVPYYVLMDRRGNIAATQRGAAGEEALESLLRRAGVGTP